MSDSYKVNSENPNKLLWFDDKSVSVNNMITFASFFRSWKRNAIWLRDGWPSPGVRVTASSMKMRYLVATEK